MARRYRSRLSRRRRVRTVYVRTRIPKGLRQFNRERRRFPRKKYGRLYLERGTDMSRNMFGETYASATPEQQAIRKATGFRGRGRYGVRKFMRDIGHISSGAKSVYDTWAPLMSGGKGLYGRPGVSVSGSGEYTMNGLIDGGRPGMQIESPNDETQDFIITHSEYMQDVYGAPTSQFNVQQWSLNPGLVQNFPFLAQISQNYEEYEFEQLLFTFKTTVDPSATNNTNGATGTIIMATNYNAAAPAFSNKESMMQYHGSNSGRVTEDHIHGVECDPSKNAGAPQKFIRNQPVVLNQDLKTFDLGTFQLAQVNIPSAFYNAQIGELWVSYRVRLSKPRLFTALCGNVQEWRACSGGSELYNRWMNDALIMQQSNLAVAMDYYGSGTGAVTTAGQVKLTLPDYLSGVLEVQVFLAGSSMVGTNIVAGYSGNVSPWADLYSYNGASSNDYCFSGTGGLSILRFNVQPVVGTTDNIITLTGQMTAGTVTGSTIIVRMTNPTFAVSPAVPLPVYINSNGTAATPVLP